MLKHHRRCRFTARTEGCPTCIPAVSPYKNRTGARRPPPPFLTAVHLRHGGSPLCIAHRPPLSWLHGSATPYLTLDERAVQMQSRPRPFADRTPATSAGHTFLEPRYTSSTAPSSEPPYRPTRPSSCSPEFSANTAATNPEIVSSMDTRCTSTST